jgi:hypothetical protein
MTGIAYEMPGATSTAFLPMPAKYAGTWMSYKQDVEGQPGTQGVPAPRDLCGPGADGGVFLGGGPSGSRNMPPRWYPTLYYLRQLPEPSLFPAGANYGGPSIYSDNQLPIPARGWGGTSFAAPGMGSRVAMLQGDQMSGRGPGIVKGRGGIILGQNPISSTPATPWWARG